MNGYSAFAEYYDKFTGNVDYSVRARYFDTVIQKYAPGAQLLLDLACGTGSLTLELEKLGYDVIGVDSSWEMLSVAAEKKAAAESKALFLCQEMGELDLYGTVQATVCALDSLNHLLTEKELLAALKRVSLFSEPGAVFVFDVNTPYKHREVLGDNCFVYEEDNVLCVWQNSFDPDSGTVDVNLDFFALQESSGLWSRMGESFSERAYSQETLRKLSEQAGFEVRAVFDEDSFMPPREDSQREMFVLIKK